MAKKELRRALVMALRSGQYKQAYGKLYDGEGYCCLGVACVVAGLVPRADKSFSDMYFFGDKEEESSQVLPYSVQEMFGFTTDNGQYNVPADSDYYCLSERNDSKKYDFDSIADIIDREPAGLFVEEKE